MKLPLSLGAGGMTRGRHDEGLTHAVEGEEEGKPKQKVLGRKVQIRVKKPSIMYSHQKKCCRFTNQITRSFSFALCHVILLAAVPG